jgi:hypothetical protein
MADLNEFDMARLAREMAMCIRPALTILKDFGITEEDYYELSKNEFFKRAKEQFTLEWNSTLSTADRVKVTSAAGAEQGLLVVSRRMLDPNEPFTSVLEGFKQLCRNAGIGDPKNEQRVQDRFVITINLGADTETYNKSVTIDPNDVNLAGDGNGKAIDAVKKVPAVQQLRPAGEGQGA